MVKALMQPESVCMVYWSEIIEDLSIIYCPSSAQSWDADPYVQKCPSGQVLLHRSKIILFKRDKIKLLKSQIG